MLVAGMHRTKALSDHGGQANVLPRSMRSKLAHPLAIAYRHFMDEVLLEARSDARIPGDLHEKKQVEKKQVALARRARTGS